MSPMSEDNKIGLGPRIAEFLRRYYVTDRAKRIARDFKVSPGTAKRWLKGIAPTSREIEEMTALWGQRFVLFAFQDLIALGDDSAQKLAILVGPRPAPRDLRKRSKWTRCPWVQDGRVRNINPAVAKENERLAQLEKRLAMSEDEKTLMDREIFRGAMFQRKGPNEHWKSALDQVLARSYAMPNPRSGIWNRLKFWKWTRSPRDIND